MRYLISSWIVLASLASLASEVRGEVMLPTAPTWMATETSYYGTGLDIGDVNGDGWLDLAVSNGNDIVAAPNFVYLSDAGSLPASASWTSADQRYSGHCQLADVDGDGWPELMVANYIGAGWGPAQVQLYDNVDGVLGVMPAWESPATFHAFRASFGDPDQDGDLDLAVATGESYHAEYEPNLVFFNEGGVLQAEPGWVSQISDACYDVTFADLDDDGDQDLVFLGGGAGVVSVYENQDGVLATTPTWTTAGADNGNTLDVADLDGDGRPDLVVGYNDQHGGSGRFAAYLTDGGSLPDTPTWTSAFSGYGSAVVCADLDRDGWLDVVAGGWWEPIRVYLNRQGSLPSEPDWQTDQAWESVVENLALADLDAGGEETRRQSGPAGRSLIQLADRHLQAVDEVLVDGVPLSDGQYGFSLRDGWVSVAAGAADAVVEVIYRASTDLDLAVSNWDDATYVFAHPDLTAAPPVGALVTRHRAAPNPFNPATAIRFTLAAAVADADLRLYDTRGREVARPLRGPLGAGRHAIPWQPRDLASGVYLYRLVADGVTVTGKLTLAR